MTVAELKKLLEQFDDNLIVEARDDYGDYDLVAEVYEDEETYSTASTYEDCFKNTTWPTRKVLRIR